MSLLSFRLLKTLKFAFYSICLSIKYKRKFNEKELKGKKYILFVTNNIGGGTAAYTKNFISKNPNLIVLKNISYGKDWGWILEIEETQKKYYLSFHDIAQLFTSKIIEEVILNTLVTNLHTFDFLELITKSGIRTIIMIHDYYCICPNYTLFIGERNCNFTSCNKTICIKQCNPFLIPVCSIIEWRKKWLCFFNYVKEIRCFSSSSSNIIKNIYPSIDISKISIVPHSMDYCKYNIVNYQKKILHIGIVGAITSKAKGKTIVYRFLRFCKNNNIPVSVIGTYSYFSRVKGKNIKYTGTYNANELQKIIEKENVNVFFFPSICSETFSYLISEQIKMGIPIVCFDYGAQADKVRAYDKGIVCTSEEPSDIFLSLKKAFLLGGGYD